LIVIGHFIAFLLLHFLFKLLSPVLKYEAYLKLLYIRGYKYFSIFSIQVNVSASEHFLAIKLTEYFGGYLMKRCM
jgi:hypothetical protein